MTEQRKVTIMVPFTIQQWLEIKEQQDLAQSTKEEMMEIDTLINAGFDAHEIISFLKLRQWYQTGGSDRIIYLRYWEFLKRLVDEGHMLETVLE